MNVHEAKVQIELQKRYGTGWMRAYPNIYAFDWECDLLAVTRSEFLIEYELKANYSDFKADFTKIKKHKRLASGKGTASRFYYVAPYGILSLREIPEYAGLIVYRKSGQEFLFNEEKKAPKLHNNHVSPEKLKNLDKAMYYKYWQLLNMIDF